MDVARTRLTQDARPHFVGVRANFTEQRREWLRLEDEIHKVEAKKDEL
jgi:hypothetical protein